MRALRLEFTGLPPSDNAIRTVGYFFGSGKRHTQIIYTKEAEDYKKTVIRAINDEHFVEVQRFVRAHKPTSLYRLSLVLYFPAAEVLNTSWLKKTRAGERGAKGPYKKLDTSNRRKLVQDCVAEACGIDDSLFWEDNDVKLVAADGHPSTFVMLEEVDPRQYGVPEEYLL